MGMSADYMDAIKYNSTFIESEVIFLVKEFK